MIYFLLREAIKNRIDSNLTFAYQYNTDIRNKFNKKLLEIMSKKQIKNPWDLVEKLYGPNSKKKYYTKEQIDEMTLVEIQEILYDQHD